MILASYAVGARGSLIEEKREVLFEYQPDSKNHEIYNRVYEIYNELYSSVSSLYPKVSQY